MAEKIIVLAEVQNGALRKNTPQLVDVARRLKSNAESRIILVLAGPKIESVATEAADLPVDQVVRLEHDQAWQGTSEEILETLHAARQELEGDILVLGNTSLGKEIGPCLAQRWGWGMISDVIRLEDHQGKPTFIRPCYAGKVFDEIEMLQPQFVLTVRSNAFPPAENDGRQAEILERVIALPKDALKTSLVEVVERPTGKVELTEADVIVSGGMGVKGPEGFEFLKPLAEVLGAAIGSSRAAVLAGFIHPSHQVGQTGKTVSPSLYIACGISGAIQHKAGMSTSKCIVAINKDPDAPIFEFADYGIVGDLFEVVPHLTEEFRKILQS